MGKYQEVRMTKYYDEEVAFCYNKDVNYITKGEEPQFLQMIYPNKSKEVNRTYPCLLYLLEDNQNSKDIYSKIPSLTKLALRGYVIAMMKSQVCLSQSCIGDKYEEVLAFLNQKAADFQFDKEHLFVLWDVTENDALTEAINVSQLVKEQCKVLKHITAVISLGGKEKHTKISNLINSDFPPVLQVLADDGEYNNGWWSEHNFDRIEDFMSNFI